MSAEKRNSDREEALYSMSVASRLAGVSPRVLRSYEDAELIQPYRTEGKTRLFSDSDIHKIRIIQVLHKEKEVNLAGIKAIFSLVHNMCRYCREQSGFKNKEIVGKLEDLVSHL